VPLFGRRGILSQKGHPCQSQRNHHHKRALCNFWGAVKDVGLLLRKKPLTAMLKKDNLTLGKRSFPPCFWGRSNCLPPDEKHFVPIPSKLKRFKELFSCEKLCPLTLVPIPWVSLPPGDLKGPRGRVSGVSSYPIKKEKGKNNQMYKLMEKRGKINNNKGDRKKDLGQSTFVLLWEEVLYITWRGKGNNFLKKEGKRVM